ncbi:hypothetical protein CLOM_g11879 [Closterium sp. NIES-68]|nr:hypothetical protein CLOM_g11879 [Closterium sp. NIES-68]
MPCHVSRADVLSLCHGLRCCVLLDYCCLSSHDLVTLLTDIRKDLTPLLTGSYHAATTHAHCIHGPCPLHHHNNHPQPHRHSPHLPPSPSHASTSAAAPAANPPPTTSPFPHPSPPRAPHFASHPFPLCDAVVAAAAADVCVVAMGGACYLMRLTALHWMAARGARGGGSGAGGEAAVASPSLSPSASSLAPSSPLLSPGRESPCTALDRLLPVLPRMPPLLLACSNGGLQIVSPAVAQSTLSHLLSFLSSLLSPPPSHSPQQRQQQQGTLAAAAVVEAGSSGSERIVEGESAGDDGFVRVRKPRRKATRWQQQQQQDRRHEDNGCRSRITGESEDGGGRNSECSGGRELGSGNGAVVVIQGDAALRACQVALPTVNGWLLGYPVVYLLPTVPPIPPSPCPPFSGVSVAAPGASMARCLAATPLSVLSVSAACVPGRAGESGGGGSQHHESVPHELLRFSVPCSLLSAPESPSLSPLSSLSPSPPPSLSSHPHYPWLQSLLSALQSRVASCTCVLRGEPSKAGAAVNGSGTSGTSGTSGVSGDRAPMVPCESVGGAACTVYEVHAASGMDSWHEGKVLPAGTTCCEGKSYGRDSCCCTGAGGMTCCHLWHRELQACNAASRSSTGWCWEQLRVAVTPAETSAVVL